MSQEGPGQVPNQKMRIEVQPPGHVGVNQTLYPPVVISIPHDVKCNMVYAYLKLPSGNFAAATLSGMSESGVPYAMTPSSGGGGGSSSSSSSHPRKYSVFPCLSIEHAGKYRIFVTAIKVHKDHWETKAYATSDEFQVYSDAVDDVTGSPKEETLLENLHLQGFWRRAGDPDPTQT
ncbi:hypothetical protein PG994_009887 [Apiospora phragmitis]|uniref:Velvet domain-containing protein n=1 Tax=Apiospora phragmitis TaxID=2905665 RepID=A0ABR1TNW8_9PEZI